MALTFDKVVNSKTYQSLNPEQQQIARSRYLQDVVAKDPNYQRLPDEGKLKVSDTILTYGTEKDTGFVKHGQGYTERVAPLMHAGSAALFDIPKAAITAGGQAMGLSKEQVKEAVFPEQKTLSGKSLRFASSVPAYIAGSWQSGLVKGGERLGAKVVPQIGSGAVAKLATTTGRKAVTGATITAPYAASQAVYEDPKAALRTMAVGTAIGAALPLAGAAYRASARGSKKLSDVTINSLVNPRESELRYGQNPGRTITALTGISKSAEELMSKIIKVKDEVGERVGKILRSSFKSVSVRSAINQLDNEIAELSKFAEANAPRISKLEAVKRDISRNIGDDIDNVPILKAWELKKLVSGITKFKGTDADDQAFNFAMKKVYGSLSNTLKESEPRLKSLFEQYGDLVTGERALERAMNRSQSHPFKLLDALAGIGAGAATGGFPGAAGGIALSYAARSTLFRTSIAKLLRTYGDSPASIKKMFDRARVIQGENLNKFKREDSRLRAVDAIIVDPKGKSFAMIGNTAVPVERLPGVRKLNQLEYNPAEGRPVPKEGEVVSGEGFTMSPFSSKAKMQEAKRLAKQRAIEGKAQPVTPEMQRGVLNLGQESIEKDANALLKQKSGALNAVIPTVGSTILASNANAEQISTNFKREEFNQRNAPLPLKDIIVDKKLLNSLEKLRKAIGNKPIKIISGYRTEKYNKRVGGAKKSQHLYGKAADIIVEGMTSRELEKFAKESGFTFTMTYKNKPHLHVDVR